MEAEEEHGGPFGLDVPGVFTQAFVIERNSPRFPKTGGWGYALFNSKPFPISSRRILPL